MFNKESNYIKRTSGPKYTNYTSDGNGRDNYIVIDNGGLHNRFSSTQLDYRSPGKYFHFKCLSRITSAEPSFKINWEASNAE